MKLTTAHEIARAHDLVMCNHKHTLQGMESMGEHAAYLVKWDIYRKALADLLAVTRIPEADDAIAELMGRKMDRRPFTDEMDQ